MKRKIILSMLLLTMLLVISPVLAGKPPEGPPGKFKDNHIWVDGEIYDTIILGDIKGTPPRKSTDDLYVFVLPTGDPVGGQRPITDVAPGIKGYNGGRWAVIPVTVTPAGLLAHDPDGNGIFDTLDEIESLTMLMHHADNLNHFEIASEPAMYFLCPLHKNK